MVEILDESAELELDDIVDLGLGEVFHPSLRFYYTLANVSIPHLIWR